MKWSPMRWRRSSGRHASTSTSPAATTRDASACPRPRLLSITKSHVLKGHAWERSGTPDEVNGSLLHEKVRLLQLFGRRMLSEEEIPASIRFRSESRARRRKSGVPPASGGIRSHQTAFSRSLKHPAPSVHEHAVWRLVLTERMVLWPAWTCPAHLAHRAEKRAGSLHDENDLSGHVALVPHTLVKTGHRIPRVTAAGSEICTWALDQTTSPLESDSLRKYCDIDRSDASTWALHAGFSKSLAGPFW